MDAIFPRWCIGCGRRLVTGERYLCLHCLAELPRTSLWLCPEDSRFTELFYGMPNVVKAAAYVVYQSNDLTGKMVKSFKYNGKKELARYCGQLMAKEIALTHNAKDSDSFFHGIDVVAPVPLTWRRKLSRGYNQSEWLARGISDVTGLPLCTDLLKRKTFAGSQTQKSVMGRIENVQDAFSVNEAKKESYRGKHLLLIDDVITVGATMKACCAPLTKIPDVKISILGFSAARTISVHKLN